MAAALWNGGDGAAGQRSKEAREREVREREAGEARSVFI